MQEQSIVSGGALFVLVVIAALAGPLPAAAQADGEYSVSARAGGINLASGEVWVTRRGGSGPERLVSRDVLGDGDAVTTGTNGRVEILLRPGSFLRVGEDSAFDWIDGSVESLRIGLVRGSAIVEATGPGDARAFVEVDAPHVAVQIERLGLYRIDNLPDGTTRVVTRQGRARAAWATSLITL